MQENIKTRGYKLHEGDILRVGKNLYIVAQINHYKENFMKFKLINIKDVRSTKNISCATSKEFELVVNLK